MFNKINTKISHIRKIILTTALLIFLVVILFSTIFVMQTEQVFAETKTTQACSDSTVVKFTPHIYDGVLNSFDYNITNTTNTTLVAPILIAGKQLSARYASVWQDGSSVRIHVDIPSWEDYSGNFNIRVSAISNKQVGICNVSGMFSMSLPKLKKKQNYLNETKRKPTTSSSKINNDGSNNAKRVSKQKELAKKEVSVSESSTSPIVITKDITNNENSFIENEKNDSVVTGMNQKIFSIFSIFSNFDLSNMIKDKFNLKDKIPNIKIVSNTQKIFNRATSSAIEKMKVETSKATSTFTSLFSYGTKDGQCRSLAFPAWVGLVFINFAIAISIIIYLWDYFGRKSWWIGLTIIVPFIFFLGAWAILDGCRENRWFPVVVSFIALASALAIPTMDKKAKTKRIGKKK